MIAGLTVTQVLIKVHGLAPVGQIEGVGIRCTQVMIEYSEPMMTILDHAAHQVCQEDNVQGSLDIIK